MYQAARYCVVVVSEATRADVHVRCPPAAPSCQRLTTTTTPLLLCMYHTQAAKSCHFCAESFSTEAMVKEHFSGCKNLRFEFVSNFGA